MVPISCAVTTQLIGVFVFTTYISQSQSEFSSHYPSFVAVYSLNCVEPGRKPRIRFSQVSAQNIFFVTGGDKVPRKGGPGITQSNLLVINKTDLAEAVGANLMVDFLMGIELESVSNRHLLLLEFLINKTGLADVVDTENVAIMV